MNARIQLAYCTNIWNHYQASLCLELARVLGSDRFRLCLFEPLHEERRALGWQTTVPALEWIAGPPGTDGDTATQAEIACTAEVAVIGACPIGVMEGRAATGRPTLLMNERLWKHPFQCWRLLNPRYFRYIQRYRRLANRQNVHYLSIGAYAAGDVRLIRAYGRRVWTWGYFPQLSGEPPVRLPGASTRILWVGRMLGWKRVDTLLRAVALIKDNAHFGGLNVVGAGPEEAKLRKLAARLGLGARCVFHGPVTPERVRTMMRESDVYVLPSNRVEGWGVVANEAMSEGCILVANEEAGAAPVLIKDGETGFLFRNDDSAGLAGVLGRLMAEEPLQQRVRHAAWKEIHRLWHPRVGAERLAALCGGLSGRSAIPAYAEGPCSPARIRRAGLHHREIG